MGRSCRLRLGLVYFAVGEPMTPEERQALREKHWQFGEIQAGLTDGPVVLENIQDDPDDDLYPTCKNCGHGWDFHGYTELPDGRVTLVGGRCNTNAQTFWQTDYDPGRCVACSVQAGETVIYPCDVIKVLDALETALERPGTADCHHWHLHVDFDGVPVETPYSSPFCPDCGASLQP